MKSAGVHFVCCLYRLPASTIATVTARECTYHCEIFALVTVIFSTNKTPQFIDASHEIHQEHIRGEEERRRRRGNSS